MTAIQHPLHWTQSKDGRARWRALPAEVSRALKARRRPLADVAVELVGLLVMPEADVTDRVVGLGPEITAACLWTRVQVLVADPADHARAEAIERLWQLWDLTCELLTRAPASSNAVAHRATVAQLGHMLADDLAGCPWLWSVDLE